jgi:hypothetical protein
MFQVVKEWTLPILIFAQHICHLQSQAPCRLPNHHIILQSCQVEGQFPLQLQMAQQSSTLTCLCSQTTLQNLRICHCNYVRETAMMTRIVHLVLFVTRKKKVRPAFHGALVSH